MDLGLPDLLSGDQPAILRPKVTLAFGSGGGDNAFGDLGAAVSDAASLAGLSSAGPSLADRLIQLRLRRGVAPGLDMADLLLLPDDTTSLAPGDSGTITIEAGDASAGFACVIDTVTRQGRGLLRATACNGGRLLAQSRVSRSYANQNAGAIIADLANLAGVDTSVTPSGASLPRYIADDRDTLLAHVARLAASLGRLAGFDDDGKLTLLDDTATGEPVATFTYGENLLDMRLSTRLPHAGATMMDGGGAADAGGTNAWAWLRKEVGPLRASNGDGPPQRRITAPWLTSQQGVSDAAAGRSRANARAASLCHLLVQGAPQVIPGAIIKLQGTPSGEGPYLVTGITHRFDAVTGLTAEVEAAPIGSGGGLL